MSSEDSQALPRSRRVPFRGLGRQGQIEITHQKLPHWVQPNVSYFITFRLADAVPMALQRQWEYERGIWLALHPQPWSDEEATDYRQRFTERMEAWLDQGMGSCCLRHPQLRTFAAQAIAAFDDQRHDLDAWVIMPNHVHLITKPRSGEDVFKLIGGMKSASARRINSTMNQVGKALWMEDCYNRIVRDGEALFAYRRYIAANPKMANLRAEAFTLIENHLLDPRL